MRTKKLNMKWQINLRLSTDSRFCLQFVEITSLAKYEPGVWDVNEPKCKLKWRGITCMLKEKKAHSKQQTSVDYGKLSLHDDEMFHVENKMNGL